MGRHRKLTAEQENQIWFQYMTGDKSIATIANELNVPYMLAYLSIKREKDYNKFMSNPVVDDPQTDTESEEQA